MTIYYGDIAGKSPRDPNGDPDRCLLCDGTGSLNAEDYCPCHFDKCDCEACDPVCECGHPHSEHRKGWACGLETFHCDCGCPEFSGTRA